jgi:hypothetical protein
MVEVLGAGVAERLLLRHRADQLDDMGRRVEDHVGPVGDAADEGLARADAPARWGGDQAG